MNLRFPILKLSLFALTIMVATLGFGGHAHADSYNSSDLIDESIFLNANSMNQGAIQSFLNAQGGGIASLTFGTPSNGLQSAAWIIANTSQYVGINPQVIMATIQKEQSAITDPSLTNASLYQYNYAMGYGCPDGGTCSFTGFYNQVLNGAWQLRFDFERAGGNNGTWTSPNGTVWGSGISYPCPGATHYYSTGLYSGRNVTFYDDYGNAYVNLTLANRSTAALYCYTPHVYPGSASEYYSGSYNFVESFINWWGYVHVPSYSATYYSQSTWPTISPGSSATAFFEYQNTGSAPWYDDSSIGSASPGNYSVHLATAEPLNRTSAFGSTWGGSDNRPALTLAAVYDSDGATLAPNQHIVQPGEIGKYSFTLSAPANETAGTYQENFQLVAEGSSNGLFNDPGTYLDITVPPVYSATASSQSSAPTLKPGQSGSATVRYQNTGNTPWYDDLSIYAAPPGTDPVHLATSNPLNRSSVFGAGWGSGQDRPALTFSAVYQSDGVTLAPSQDVVQPGQIGQFTIPFQAPSQQASGTYQEYFQPVAEGTDDGAFNNPGTNFNVVVASSSVGTATVSAASATSMNPGSSQQFTASFTNTGNTTWTPSNTTLIGNPSTQYQSFKSSTWPSSTEVATLNQSSVAPGATGTFTFTLTAPNSGGSYYLELAPSSGSSFFSPAPAEYQISVAAPVYSDQYVSQSAYPSLYPGGQATGYFEYKNTGNVNWYDDSSIGSAPTGSYPIHLATSSPINRASVFGSTWGANQNRPASTFAAVYQSDGVTLTTNQHVVQPGQIAKFSFTFNASASQAPGTYQEAFRPIAEGSADGALNDPGTYLDVTVMPQTYTAQYVSQSAYPTIAQGSTGTGYFEYKNTGNQTWYDDTGLSGAASGTLPVHLATGEPINRASVFGSTWGANQNRPASTFAAVYQSDGVTLTTNQHAVAPGQIAKFSFTFTAPSNLPTGVYQEAFQPVLEGSANGAFSDPGTYLDVTVIP
ncbi:MAG TPA: hypothetical protein VMR75_01765 [Candidatus Saccharimonadales bacterium]|nr:hypothetical protein [Candidatus Saccharimonadales bacterium]